jgi:hypothetical protein
MKLVHHVPVVHALAATKKIVCHELGDEALFPSASELVECPRMCDSDRRDTAANDLSYLMRLQNRLLTHMDIDEVFIPDHRICERAYFRPTPYLAVDIGDSIDVVLCPRQRQYGQEKNWPHWRYLCELLKARGYRLFAAGAPDSSDRSLTEAIPSSWQYQRYLDATIAAMRRTRLVVATDSGLAHLAVWCGTPILLISHQNRLVAPGPVRDGSGTITRKHYWPINMRHYSSENHLCAQICVLDHTWDDPHAVVNAVITALHIPIRQHTTGPC